jgi:acetyl esterase
MPIDSQLAAWYARLGREFPPLAEPTPAARRERYEAITRLLAAPAPAGVSVRDLSLPLAGRNIAIRLYHPGGKPGLLVFYHGGGWVTGSLATHHDLCLRIASESGVAVASVDYRLAPEHAYPAPCEDAYDALSWLAAHAGELGSGTGCDPTRIAVGGDSAGAHLAAVSALMAAERGGPELAFQWLIYPTIEPDFTTRSQIEFAAGPGLSGAEMKWFWQQFLGGGFDCPDYRASPARAASLLGLPPAYVLVAELDLLRDEGERYATQLDEAGVRTELVRALDMTHGFARLPPVCDAAGRYMQAAIVALKEGLA